MNGSEPKRELTLLRPCLNEAETVERCIRKAHEAVDRLNVAGEVVVADNGSTDGSQEIARRLGARVIDVPRKGYGSALMAGIEAARGKYIIMADADDSYDWSDIQPFLERLRGGYDLVMGCRLPSGGGKISKGAMPVMHRWLGNPVLSRVGKLFFRCPVTDFHCGMRAFSKTAVEGLNLRTTGMEFASEMVIKATLAGLRIAEVPTTLYPDGRSRPPHLRTWHDGWRHLRFMLIYSPKWLFLVPGVLAFMVGIVGFALLLPGQFDLGGVALDANTLLLCSLACMAGFQWISFGILARVFAITEGLLPENRLLSRLFSKITLEVGIALGLLLSLAGGVLILGALLYWKRFNFGELPYPIGLRMVIPAVTLLALGVQVVFTSFFLSLLGLKRK